MTTILDAVVEYITKQIEEQDEGDNNSFHWNDCKVPEVESAINCLNYVNYSFLVRHFGENDFSIIADKFGDINVDLYDDDILSIELGDVMYHVTHDADYTISCIGAGDDTIANADEILDAAQEYVTLFDAINKHYMNGIDKLLAKEYSNGND